MMPLDYGRSFLIGTWPENEVRFWVESRTRIIDEQPFARWMALTHDRRQFSFPASVEFAVPAVAIAVRMNGSVFLPQQRKRDPFLAQFGMHVSPVWLWNSAKIITLPLREKVRLKIAVAEIDRKRPVQTGSIGAAQIFPQGCAPHR